MMLEDNLEDIESLLFFIIFIIAFLFFWLQWLIENIKLTKNRTIDVFYVKVKDWNNTYFSNAYKKWEINWTSHEELKEIYKSYWFHYDEDQTKKREILQEIDRIIAETQFEIDNWGFLGNISRKRNLAATKEDREKVEYWYIPPYWQVEWNKISVWDMVDVYINPDKPDIYWVDIDFLFEK